MSKTTDYKKQRRNTYGESPQASRRNISRGKRRQNRAVRRSVRAGLRAEDDGDIATLQKYLARKHKFEKRPDQPLGRVLVAELMRRYLDDRSDEDHFVSTMERLRTNYPGFHSDYKAAFEVYSTFAPKQKLSILKRYV